MHKVKSFPRKNPNLMESIAAILEIDDLVLKANTIEVFAFYKGTDVTCDVDVETDTYAEWLQSQGKLTGVHDGTDAAGDHVQSVTDIDFITYWYNADLKEKYQDMKEYLMKPPVIAATDKKTIVHQLRELAKTA